MHHFAGVFLDKKFPNGNHTILREGDNTVVDSDEVAEIFNAYFSSIASEIGFNDEHVTPDEAISAYHNHSSIVKIRDVYGDNMQSFNFQTVKHNCVARKLQMINIRKATGYDNIPVKLLRLAQNELTHPIANLINNTMAMNTFPDQRALSWVPYSKRRATSTRRIFDPSVFWLASRSFMNLLSTISFWNISLDYLMI